MDTINFKPWKQRIQFLGWRGRENVTCTIIAANTITIDAHAVSSQSHGGQYLKVDTIPLSEGSSGYYVIWPYYSICGYYSRPIRYIKTALTTDSFSMKLHIIFEVVKCAVNALTIVESIRP